ncbi:UNVERIFIED_CONTAM: hypothetical protein RMT77_012056 [Armadillidium vulgare]
MGLMSKTLGQLWASFYVASQDMEGVKVENVEVYPQVRISRLTDKEIQDYARKNNYVNAKKKLNSRPNRISSESEDSEYEPSEDIASEDDLDLELQSTFIDDGSASSVSNEDDDDFLPDINPKSSNEKDKVKSSVKSKTSQAKSVSDNVDQEIVRQLKEPKIFKKLVHSLAEKKKADTKPLSFKLLENFENSKVSELSTLTQKEPSDKFSPNKSQKTILGTDRKELPQTQSNKKGVNSSPLKLNKQKITKNVPGENSLKTAEYSSVDINEKIFGEIKKALKRPNESQSSSSLNKIPQEKIASYVDYENSPPSKKLRPRNISSQILKESKYTQTDAIESAVEKEEEKLPLLSKPTVSIINIEIKKMDSKFINLSSVEDVKYFSDSVNNVNKNLKNHKEELEKERDIEIENLKKKYNTKFQEVDEKIKEFMNLDDDLISEIRNMRLNNSECSMNIKEKVSKLLGLFPTAEKTTNSEKGADVEKSESVIKNTKGNVTVHVDSKSGTSTKQDSVIGNKSDSYTKQPNPVIGPRKAAKSNNVFKVNTSSLISAPSKSKNGKKQEALSDPKGSEENLRCYPSSQVKSNISPVVKPSTSSTPSTLLTAKNSPQSSWEVRGMTISRSKPTLRTMPAIPAIRTIPEANVDRFGTSNSKVTIEKTTTSGTAKNQEATQSMSSNTVNTSLPSTFHLPSSNVQNLSGTADSQSNQVPSLSVNPSLLTPSSFNVNNSITGPITVTTAPHLPVKPISTHSTYIPPSGINTSKNTPTGNVPHHMSQQKQQQQANQHLQKMQMSSQQPQQQIHQQVHKVQVSSHSQQQNLKLLTKMQVPSRPQQQTHQQLQQVQMSSQPLQQSNQQLQQHHFQQQRHSPQLAAQQPTIIQIPNNPVYLQSQVSSSVGNIYSQQSNQFPPNVTIQSTAPSVQQGVNLSHSPYPVILSSTSLPTYAQSVAGLQGNQQPQTTGNFDYQPVNQRPQQLQQQQQQQLRQQVHQQVKQDHNRPLLPKQQQSRPSILRHHQQQQQIVEVTPIVTPIITNTVSLAGGVSGNQNFVGNVMQDNSSERTCFLCGYPAKVFCCGAYVYCSTKCQSEDYERHKQECLKLG